MAIKSMSVIHQTYIVSVLVQRPKDTKEITQRSHDLFTPLSSDKLYISAAIPMHCRAFPPFFLNLIPDP